MIVGRAPFRWIPNGISTGHVRGSANPVDVNKIDRPCCWPLPEIPCGAGQQTLTRELQYSRTRSPLKVDGASVVQPVLNCSVPSTRP